MCFSHYILNAPRTSFFMQKVCATVFPQFLQPVADIDWGPLAQRPTFCQEQEQNSVNMAPSTPVQPPGTLFHPTFMTLLIRLHSDNDSRMYFLIVLTTDYCWHSRTNRMTAPYKSRVDWLIEIDYIAAVWKLGIRSTYTMTCGQLKTDKQVRHVHTQDMHTLQLYKSSMVHTALVQQVSH